MATFGKRTHIPGVTASHSAVPRPWLTWILAILLVSIIGGAALVLAPRLIG